MIATATPPPAGVSPETLAAVRQGVREVLGQSAAFQALPPDKQREIARQTVQIASYLAEPDGIRADRLPTARTAAADPYARAAKSDVPDLGSTDDPQFKAQAAREGAEAAGLFLEKVNFSEFVGGLIKNVFQAIVTSSIEQMEAYGKLVADVSKSLNQFRDENVSVNQGRDHLVEQFPDTFFLDMDTGAEGGGPRVRVRDGVDDRQALQRINQSLPLDGGAPLTSLDDEAVEEKLVPAARTQLATSRQQLLATMVLMGINRIVVTDGRIQAKVLFDFQARDNFKFQKSATRFDYHETLTKDVTDEAWDQNRQNADVKTTWKDGKWDQERSGGSYFSKGHYKHSSEPMLTLASASQLQNDAALTTKAQLMGNVEVNFKSDFLPLEKMADSFQIAKIQENSRPAATAAPRGATAAPAPAQPAPAAPTP